jgi:O-antigen ligase
MGASTYWAPDPTFALAKWFSIVTYGLIPGVTLVMLERQGVNWQAFLAVGAVYLLLVAATGTIVEGRWRTEQINPIWIGRSATYLLMVAVLERQRLGAWKALCAAVIAMPLMFLADSRGPVLALVAGLVAARMRFQAPTLRSRGARFTLPAFSLAALLICLVSWSWIAERTDESGRLRALVSLSGPSLDEGRPDLMAAGLELFESAPIWGRGLGATAVLGAARHPHNVLVELGAEVGTIGVTLFCLVVVLAVRVRNRVAFGLTIAAFVNGMLSGDLGSNAILIASAIAFPALPDSGQTRAETSPKRALAPLRGTVTCA